MMHRMVSCIPEIILTVCIVAFYLPHAMQHSVPCIEHPQCSCNTTESSPVAVNCRKRNLTDILRFGPEVGMLDMSDNNISTFNNCSNENLRTLDLSKNNIAWFSEGSTANLTNLRELNLRENAIDFNHEVFYEGVFYGLINLEYLNLKKNAQQSENNIYPDRAFADLVSLKQLKMDGLEVLYFGAGFKNLTHLSDLDISGHGGYCYTTYLLNNTFENLPYLQRLDMSKCRIIEIPRGTLRLLSSLVSLEISYNDRLTLDVFRNVTCDFPPTLKIFKARKLHCTYGRGTKMYIDDILCLKNTSLEEIYVDRNRLELLEEGSVQYLPQSLNLLSIEDNRFLFGKYLFQVSTLKNLTILYISKQYFPHSPFKEENEVFSCVDKLRCPSQDQGVQSRSLDMEIDQEMNNFLYHNDMPLGFILTFTLPPNLKKIYSNNSNLRGEIPSFSVDTDNSVELLDLSQNYIPKWLGPVTGFIHLKYLDLSNCFCTYVSPNFFDESNNLEILHLQSNLLGFNQSNFVNGTLFQSISKLRTLDLSDNRISDLPKEVFGGLPNLQLLRLQNNSLSTFDFDVFHMKHISLIDLSTNEITSFTDELSRQLDNLARNTTFKINMNGNPFQCTCNTLNSLRWMKSRSLYFHQFEHYDCYLANQSQVSFKTIDQVLKDLDLNCSSYLGLLIGAACFDILFLFTLLFALVYRFRWKLRYLYYMTRNMYCGYTKLQGSEEPDQYLYDAFISHAGEDEEFAVNETEQNLENENDQKLKLCIAGRDFKPGIPIAANITYAINNSRKMIVVLTRNYLKSHWCMYELNIARMESIYNRNGADVLHIIMYEDIPLSQLPHQIMEIVHQSSYIKYPNDPSENTSFWDKLKEVLST